MNSDLEMVLYELSRQIKQEKFNNKQNENKYKEEILNNFYRLSDRGCFSDYNGYLATGVVRTYVEEIKKYIKRKEFNRSFNILKALLWSLGEIQIDCSNGE